MKLTLHGPGCGLIGSKIIVPNAFGRSIIVTNAFGRPESRVAPGPRFVTLV